MNKKYYKNGQQNDQKSIKMAYNDLKSAKIT